jgi:hypothetical protein
MPERANKGNTSADCQDHCNGYAVSYGFASREVRGKKAANEGSRNTHKNASKHDEKWSFRVGRLTRKLKECKG